MPDIANVCTSFSNCLTKYFTSYNCYYEKDNKIFLTSFLGLNIINLIITIGGIIYAFFNTNAGIYLLCSWGVVQTIICTILFYLLKTKVTVSEDKVETVGILQDDKRTIKFANEKVGESSYSSTDYNGIYFIPCFICVAAVGGVTIIVTIVQFIF